jgi:hypothetical protein
LIKYIGHTGTAGTRRMRRKAPNANERDIPPIDILLFVAHGLSPFVGPVIRISERKQAGRIEAFRHRRATKGNGQHGSAANGAGSAVDGTPRLASVEE